MVKHAKWNAGMAMEQLLVWFGIGGFDGSNNPRLRQFIPIQNAYLAYLFALFMDRNRACSKNGQNLF